MREMDNQSVSPFEKLPGKIFYIIDFQGVLINEKKVGNPPIFFA